jgi:glutamate carboxypeptidase
MMTNSINRNDLKRGWRTVLLLAVFLLECVPAVAQISDIEQRIVQAVDSANEYYQNVLVESVNKNSGTLNFVGVRNVYEHYRDELEKLGIKAEWIDGSEFGRAGHLVARHEGPGPELLLIGHLDTVFETDSPFQTLEMVNDSTARGPGIADMKGGNVIIIAALNALRDAGVLDQLNVTIVMTGDEERSGSPISLARKALTDAADRADIALAFENSDGDPRTAVVARRGSTSWRLSVSGTPAHSSQIFKPEVGAGAIYETSRILYSFYNELSSVENLTFNPGLIIGGTDIDYDGGQARGTAFGKNNVVAEHATVSGDIRAISPAQLEEAKASMQSIVANSLPGTSAELEFRDSYPPLAPTEGNYRLLSIYDTVSQDLGYGPVGPVNPRNAGAADVSFTAGRVEMAIDGLGLGGSNDHTVNETGDLWTFPMQTKRAAVLMHRLSSGVQ